DTALDLINPPPARFVSRVLGQRARPWNVIRIYVQDAAIRIISRTTPFRAAIETGENHRILPQGKRHKLTVAAHFVKLFNRPLMRLGRSGGQHVLGKKLTGERRWFGGERLLGRRDFSEDIARGILSRLQGKQGSTLRTIKDINKSLLAGLGNCGDLFAFAPHGYQCWRRGEVAVPQVVFYRLKVPNALASLCIQRY